MKEKNFKLGMFLVFAIMISVFNPMITSANEDFVQTVLVNEDTLFYEDELPEVKFSYEESFVGEESFHEEERLEDIEEMVEFSGSDSTAVESEEVEEDSTEDELLQFEDDLVPLVSNGMLRGGDASSHMDIVGLDILIDYGNGFEDFIVNGAKVSGRANPIVGQSIRFKYNWKISSEDLEEIQLGDLIYLNLPTYYFSFADFSDKRQISDGSGGSLGELWIENNKVVIELNAYALSKDSLEMGYLYADGRLESAGNSITVDVNGIALPPFDVEEPEQTNNEGENELTSPIYKYGFQQQNRDEIYWSTRINYDNASIRFNENRYNYLYNAFFVDTLQGGQTFSDLEIKTILHPATENGKMARNPFDYYKLADFENTGVFQKISAFPGETVEEFMGRLKANRVPAFGVIDDKTVVVYFSDVPNNILTLPREYTDNGYQGLRNLLETRARYGDITEQMLYSTFNHYYYGNEYNLMLFEVVIHASVDEDAEDGPIGNVAQLIHDRDSISSENALVNFQSVGGGATAVEAGSVEIVKVDGNDAPLSGVGFRLDKLAETTGEYIEYKSGSTDNKGKLKFKHLPYGRYKIVETAPLEGYGAPEFEVGQDGSFEITGADEHGHRFKIRNVKDDKYNDESFTELTVEKVWVDDDDRAGKRPSEIAVELYQNGIAKQVVKLNEENEWKYTWDELPESENEKLFEYTVKEKGLFSGYTASYGDNIGGVIKITNTYEEPSIDLRVEKIWNDDDNIAGKRPDEIEVELYYNGSEYKTAKLNAKNNWKYTWEELPKYEDGKLIEYKILEVKVPSEYISNHGEIENGVMTITNTYTPKSEPEVPTEPEKTDVKVLKIWNDGDDVYGIRPDSIEVQLYMNGEVHGEVIELSDKNNWQHSWSELDKYSGEEIIKYTVLEVEVAKGYEVSYGENDGTLTITNTHIESVEPVIPTEPTMPLVPLEPSLPPRIPVYPMNPPTISEIPEDPIVTVNKKPLLPSEEISTPLESYISGGAVDDLEKDISLDEDVNQVGPEIINDGLKEEILPKTGLVDMTLLTVLGTTMLAFGGALLKKKK